MTDRLELNWVVDGFVDEQRYYCDTSPINHENPPPPKAILAGDERVYIDTAITGGEIYYVRISTVKNNVEKFSAEVSIMTPKTAISYRYFQVLINSAQGDVVAIEEIEIAATHGGGDITTPSMTVTASSSTYPASNAFDNNAFNFWMSAGAPPTVAAPQWIRIDLSGIKELKEVRMRKWTQYGFDKMTPKDFIFQGSNDGLSWEDIAAYSNVVKWSEGITSLKFNLEDGTYV